MRSHKRYLASNRTVFLMSEFVLSTTGTNLIVHRWLGTTGVYPLITLSTFCLIWSICTCTMYIKTWMHAPLLHCWWRSCIIFASRTQKLVDRWDRCLKEYGQYIEEWSNIWCLKRFAFWTCPFSCNSKCCLSCLTLDELWKKNCWEKYCTDWHCSKYYKWCRNDEVIVIKPTGGTQNEIPYETHISHFS